MAGAQLLVFESMYKSKIESKMFVLYFFYYVFFVDFDFKMFKIIISLSYFL